MRLSVLRLDSIRARMTAGFALFSAALMLTMCAGFFAYSKNSDRRITDQNLAQAAVDIRQELREQAIGDVGAAAFVREQSQGLRVHRLALLVLDRRGRILAHSPPPFPSWPLRGDRWRAVVLESGAQSVVIAAPWYKTERALRERTLLLLGLSALVVLAASAGAWVLVGRTLSPIDRLARHAQTASTQSLQVRLEAPSRDAEIERLVATLNDLLARLGETAASQGRFYADASHELRTPLQALTGHMEVALSRPRSAAEYEIALRESHAQAERLTSLAQDLLLLNQLDADTSHPPGALLDLADICASELQHLRALAESRGLEIEAILPAKCEVVAPWNHATMLLRNILENAVKYAMQDSAIRVRLNGEILSVCNDCAPLDHENLDKLFEPFFRPDAARNSQTGGNGLGLAICRAICQSNGWNIELRQDQNGMCAVVVFCSQPKSTP